MRVMNFIAGFLGGVVIGAVAVLLTVPQSGSDFQMGVRARFDDMVAEGRKASAAKKSELEARLATLRAG